MGKATNLFHVGPQKSGTTWLYQALRCHPDISAPEVDTINYFDINYCKGESWYESFFTHDDEKIRFDPTYTYIRNKRAPERISKHNPNAKIMLTARDPIERAFSHYWHEKKKDRFDFNFYEVFRNYDLFENWIEPGMYALHYRRFLEFFPKDQIKILFFQDLQDDPERFFEDVCRYCEIDNTFMPPVLGKRINEAGQFKSRTRRAAEQKIRTIPGGDALIKIVNRMYRGNKENLGAVDLEVKNSLVEIFYDDICELEAITGRDLKKWKGKYDV